MITNEGEALAYLVEDESPMLSDEIFEAEELVIFGRLVALLKKDDTRFVKVMNEAIAALNK